MKHPANDNGTQLEGLDRDVQAAVAHAWASVLADDLTGFNAALTQIQVQHSAVGLASTLVDLITCAQPVLAHRWGIANPATIGVRFRAPADRSAAPNSGPAATRFMNAALAYDRESAIEAFVTLQNRDQVDALLDLCWGWLHSVVHDNPPARASGSDQPLQR